MPTYHQMLFEVMEKHRGETLATGDIENLLLEAYPKAKRSSIRPNDHSDEGNLGQCWCAKTDDRIFNKISHGLFQILQDRPLIDDLRNIQESSETDTTKKILTDARIGQGKFREKLIAHWKFCAVTGIALQPILKASHIKPWKDSSNKERLDSFNGLLLSPNLDALFDLGYISFNDDGTIIISPLIENQADNLDVEPNMRIEKSKLTKEHFNYLEFHRKNVYKSN